MRIAEQPIPAHRACVALGGGGARGLAHLGALGAIERSGIAIDRFVGVSIGALAGAVAAFSDDLEEVTDRAIDYLTSETFRNKQLAMFGSAQPATSSDTGLFSWYERIRTSLRSQHLLSRIYRRPSLLPSALVRDVVDHLVPDANIADAPVPLCIVAVDLYSGHRVALEKGPLREAIMASTAIPGIFPPVPFEGMLLCDIGVFESLPTEVARTYSSELTIGVDVGPNLAPITECETALDVLMRMDEIIERHYRRLNLPAADIVIRPDVSQIRWFEFDRPTTMIEAGRVAGADALQQYFRLHRESQSDETNRSRSWLSWWRPSA